MTRDRLLLVGSSGAGKSQAIVDIAKALPDSQVFALDIEDSISPLIRGRPVPNLNIMRIGIDIVEEDDEAQFTIELWHSLIKACKDARSQAGPGDFIAFDKANLFSEQAMAAFVAETYGKSLLEHRSEKIQDDDTGFGGFTANEWAVINGKYYLTIPRTLSIRCLANVVVTAIETTPPHWVDKASGQMVFREEHLPYQYKRAKIKPAGHKALTEQVDVVMRLQHPAENKWTLGTLGKNRFGVEFDNIDVTGLSVWEVYCEQLGVDPGVAPGV